MEVRLSEVERKAHDFLLSTHERISPADFGDLYGEDVVNRDQSRAEEMAVKLAKKDTPLETELRKIAEVFEMLLPELVELYNWMGDNVFVINTSKFDDIFNGTDLVAEFLKDGSFNYLGLAIDVTFSSGALDNKIKAIAQKIKDGELPMIKYFKSEGGDFRGELSKIARVVIGVDRRTINELAEARLILNNLSERKMNPAPYDKPEDISRQIREIKEKFSKHPFQITILEQIKMQLERYAGYATKVGQPSIAEKYLSVLSIIDEIYQNKVENEDVLKSDNIYSDGQNLFSEIEESLNNTL